MRTLSCLFLILAAVTVAASKPKVVNEDGTNYFDPIEMPQECPEHDHILLKVFKKGSKTVHLNICDKECMDNKAKGLDEFLRSEEFKEYDKKRVFVGYKLDKPLFKISASFDIECRDLDVDEEGTFVGISNRILYTMKNVTLEKRNPPHGDNLFDWTKLHIIKWLEGENFMPLKRIP